MDTWRTAPQMDHETQMLLRQGLLIEYAPGCTVPADLASIPVLRAELISRIVVADAVAILWSALWIHTGWHHPEKLSVVCAAHPRRTKAPYMFRTAIAERSQQRIGPLKVTTAARTAADLLVLDGSSQALDAVFVLLNRGLNPTHLQRELEELSTRPRYGFAVGVAAALPHYLKERSTRYHHCEMTFPSLTSP